MLNVSSTSLLIEAAAENQLLDYLLLLQDVYVLTGTLESVFLEALKLRQATVKYFHRTEAIIFEKNGYYYIGRLSPITVAKILCPALLPETIQSQSRF